MAEDAKKSAGKTAEQKGEADNDQITKPSTTDTTTESDDTNQSNTKATEVQEGEITAQDTQDKDNAKESDTTINGTDTNSNISDSEDDSDHSADDEDSGKNSRNDASESTTDSDGVKESDQNIEIQIEMPASGGLKTQNTDFQDSVREQIENCKFEIISALQESIHKDLTSFTDKQIRKVERRRRAGIIIRDILILILAAVVGYFGYCLYDAKYFYFMKQDCSYLDACDNNTNQNDSASQPEVVKDTAWYVNNYGDLLRNLQLDLSGDKISAYYLYSNDLKASEIQPSYLLGMAYNNLNANVTYDSDAGIVIPSVDLRTAFVDLFGTADYFTKQNFVHGCVDFTYDRATDSFITPTLQCVNQSHRHIIETVTDAREEGNVLYFFTTAAIFDDQENSFYTFDDLFKPAVKNVTNSEQDLAKYQASLNQYQYRFKRIDDKFYFSDIAKLK